MKNRSTVTTLSVMASTLSLAIASLASAEPELHHPEKPTYKYEKCYAVAKAGQNDCFTSSNACAGTSKQDDQSDSWIYLPEGSCQKITGGKLEPKI